MNGQINKVTKKVLELAKGLLSKSREIDLTKKPAKGTKFYY